MIPQQEAGLVTHILLGWEVCSSAHRPWLCIVLINKLLPCYREYNVETSDLRHEMCIYNMVEEGGLLIGMDC